MPLDVDKAGRNVLVANYTGGSLACLPIDVSGRLSASSSSIQHQGRAPIPRRQQGPHAHSINLDAAGRFAVAADLGLDRVFVYRFDIKRNARRQRATFHQVAPHVGSEALRLRSRRPVRLRDQRDGQHHHRICL